MNLSIAITDNGLSLDGQFIPIPFETQQRLAKDGNDPQYRRFLVNVVYLVAHKRIDFEAHAAAVKSRSAYTRSSPVYVGLLEACCGFDQWDDRGWLLAGVRGDGNVELQRRGAELRVIAPFQTLVGSPSEDLVGKVVTVRSPSFRPHLSIGYHFIIGPNGGPAATDALVRIYLNCTPLGACLILMDLARYALETPLCFQAKFRNHPEEYGSADSGVIYLDPETFARHREALIAMFARHSAELKEATSYFTDRLMPGVSMATEKLGPRTTVKSFGELSAAQFVDDALRRRLSADSTD